MASHDEVDSYLIKMGLPYEQVSEGTWVVHPEGEHRATIGVTIEAPIVLFSIPIFELAATDTQREPLFRALLELNADLLHSSYRLEGDRVVLTGAQQLENLDFNEFQAMVDDMCIALDNHIDRIAPLIHRGAHNAAAAEGSA
ncbi:MAG: YbjN domain-containing protein [Deltaproteobacteria bacterium]|nr:YbjN domain-containing protein [Deltaproteobacteria bacterium]